MSNKAKQLITYTTLIIIGLYFLLNGLMQAQAFLVPILISGLLAMLLLPVVKQLIKWHIPRGLAILLADVLLVGFIIGLLLIIGAQTDKIIDNWAEYNEKIEPKITKVQNYIEAKTGISAQEQKSKLKNILTSKSRGDGSTSGLKGIFAILVSFSGNFLLVFVYIFFFLFYKDKFKNGLLNFLPKDKTERGKIIIYNFSRVSQQYLFGKFLLIVLLAVIYSVGLLIIGVKHAILISLIAAVFTLIPYIGNIIGVILTMSMSLLTNGSLGEIIGILILFSLTQFIESYFLEPFVVGHQVEINPVVTIIGVILGGAIWGLTGMIIAIPIMGILKAIFDNVPILNPLGYLLDEQDATENGWMEQLKDKIVSWIR